MKGYQFTSTKLYIVFQSVGSALPPTRHLAFMDKSSNRISTVGNSMPTLHNTHTHTINKEKHVTLDAPVCCGQIKNIVVECK
mgnify:CR=1 FL=1